MINEEVAQRVFEGAAATGLSIKQYVAVLQDIQARFGLLDLFVEPDLRHLVDDLTYGHA
jgi:hypothetical protein